MLRAGIIGCGGITERRHAPVLTSFVGHVELAALADVSEARLALIDDKYSVSPAHRYTDYEAMLKNESLDLVHVCTPHHLHKPQAIAALQAGSHVLMEKPVATTVEEADHIIEAADHAGKKLTISHNQLTLTDLLVDLLIENAKFRQSTKQTINKSDNQQFPSGDRTNEDSTL